MPEDDKIDIEKKDVAGGVKLSEGPTGQGNGENLDINNLTAAGDGVKAKKNARGIEINLELPQENEAAAPSTPPSPIRSKREPTFTKPTTEQPNTRPTEEKTLVEKPPIPKRRESASATAKPTEPPPIEDQQEAARELTKRKQVNRRTVAGGKERQTAEEAPATEETPLVPEEYGRPIPSAPDKETETTAEEQPSGADRARLPQGGAQAAAAGLASRQAQGRFRAGSDASAKELAREQKTLNNLETTRKKILKKEKANKLTKTFAKLVITSEAILTILWYFLKIFYYLILYKGGKKTKAVAAQIEQQKRKLADIRKKIGRSQQIRQRTAQLAASVRRG